jgi:hypothetical protein
MAGQTFSIDLKDVKKLIKQFRVNEKEFKSAVINVLNSQAFGMKSTIPIVIKDNMTVRNPRFVSTSIQVSKASMKNPVAVVGSVRRPSFSGWVEQETGQKSDRNRIPTKAARRGNWANRIAPSLRMKPGNKFLSDRSIVQTARSGKQRIVAMLSYIERQNYRKPFILSGSTKFKKGLYKRVGKKFKLIQHLDAPRTSVKRVKWMGKSIKKYFVANDPLKVWRESVKRIVSFRKKR